MPFSGQGRNAEQVHRQPSIKAASLPPVVFFCSSTFATVGPHFDALRLFCFFPGAGQLRSVATKLRDMAQVSKTEGHGQKQKWDLLDKR